MNRIKTYCFLLFIVFSNQSFLFSQCNSNNVLEAVVNGDFENGNDGSFTNQLRDFALLVLNNPPCIVNGSCNYSTSGDYLIDSNQNNLCPSCWDKYEENGIKPKGLAMFIDGPNTSGVTIWQQTVNVFPGQTYYFSAMVALLDVANPSSLQLYINNIPLKEAFNFASLESDVGKWFQISTTWDSNTNTTVTLKLVTSKNFADASGNDFVLDDISFINSCQNIPRIFKLDLGEDLNICTSTGTITLDAKIKEPGLDFSWYEGTSFNQIAASSATGVVLNPSNKSSIIINKPGTYRVCVDDGHNCEASTTVKIYNTLNTPIETTDYCVSPNTQINVDISAPSLSYKWSVPVAATNPGNEPIAIGNVLGTYSVTVTGLSGSGWSCSTKASTTISTSLPTYDTSLVSSQSCYESSQTFNNLGTGANSKNYKWYDALSDGNLLASGPSPNFTMPSTGNTFDVYLEDLSTASLSGSPLFDTTLTEQSFGGNNAISFNVLKKIALQSVKIKQQQWTGGCFSIGSVSVVIELVQENNVINTVNASVSCGVEAVVPLNFVLPIGQYTLRIKGGNGNVNPSFYSTKSKVVSAEIPGFVSVTSNGMPSNFNSPFASLVFNKLNVCDRVLVQIPIKNCCASFAVTASSNSPLCERDSLRLFCSESSMKSYNWAGPESFVSTRRNPLIQDVFTNMSGTYTVTVTNMVNCTNTASVVVAINSIDSIHVFDTIPKGDSAFFNTIFIKEAGQYFITVPNQNGCDSVVQLNVSIDSISKFYHVSGNVYEGDFLLQNGTVKLLTSDVIKGESTIKTTNVSNGFYQFNYIKKDKYTLLAQSTINDEYLPTYFGDKINSRQATFIDTYGDVGHADIHLVQKINDIESNDNNINIALYPNPVKNELILSITLFENSNIDLSIYDVTGKFVSGYSCNLNQGKNTIELNTTSYEAGYYLIKVVINQQILQLPFVK